MLNTMYNMFSKAYALSDFMGYDPVLIDVCFPNNHFFSVIVGVLLGNGTLLAVRDITSGSKESHSKLSLKLSTNADFVMGYITSFFGAHNWLPNYKLVNNCLPPETKKIDATTNTICGERIFYSGRNECFSQLRLWWYPTKRKTVPNDIGTFLNEVTIGVWYMLSGRLFEANKLGFVLESPFYNLKTVTLLASLLKLNYGWDTTISVDLSLSKGKVFHLVFTEASSQQFAILVAPHILPAFEAHFVSFEALFEKFGIKLGSAATSVLLENTALIAKKTNKN
jgi:hypothetical protein